MCTGEGDSDTEGLESCERLDSVASPVNHHQPNRGGAGQQQQQQQPQEDGDKEEGDSGIDANSQGSCSSSNEVKARDKKKEKKKKKAAASSSASSSSVVAAALDKDKENFPETNATAAAAMPAHSALTQKVAQSAEKRNQGRSSGGGVDKLAVGKIKGQVFEATRHPAEREDFEATGNETYIPGKGKIIFLYTRVLYIIYIKLAYEKHLDFPFKQAKRVTTTGNRAAARSSNSSNNSKRCKWESARRAGRRWCERATRTSLAGL